MKKRKSHSLFLDHKVRCCTMNFLEKGWLVSLKLLLCVLPYVLAIFEEHRCQPGQFKVLTKNAESFIRCQTCYMCPPGYGVHKECSETADTVCKRCPEGSYSDSSTRRGECKQCTPCMDEYDTLQECTSNSDRVCRNPCDTGKFLNVELRRCESCSFCHDNANVNVSRNAQCENQGLPPMWRCWPNITVAVDNEDTNIVVNTGETYSYITATEKSKSRQQMFGIQLEEYLDMMQRTETSPPTSMTTWSFGTGTQTLSAHVGATLKTTAESIVENNSYFPDLTPKTESKELEFLPSQQKCSQGLDAVVFWIVFATFALLIGLIAAMAIIIYGYHKESIKADCERQTQNRQCPQECPEYSVPRDFLFGNEDSVIPSTMRLLPPPYSSNPDLYRAQFDYNIGTLTKV